MVKDKVITFFFIGNFVEASAKFAKAIDISLTNHHSQPQQRRECHQYLKGGRKEFWITVAAEKGWDRIEFGWRQATQKGAIWNGCAGWTQNSSYMAMLVVGWHYG